jgi:hypothetical protein
VASVSRGGVEIDADVVDERTQQGDAVAGAAELEPAVDAQARVAADDPGTDFQPLTREGRGEVVDLRAPDGHAATVAGDRRRPETQCRRVGPCGMVQPAHVDGVVDVAIAVDVVARGNHRVHVGRGEVPVVHVRAASDRAGV